MKIKLSPVIIYPFFIIVVIIVLIIFLNQEKKIDEQLKKDNSTTQIPQDEVHKNLSGNEEMMPSKSNVAEGVKHELEMFKKKIESNPSDTATAKKLAELLLAGHQPDEALKYYHSIIEINPERIDAMFGIAVVYHQKGEFNKAEEVTNKILKIDKNNTLAIYNLGAIAATRGEKEKAKKIWNALIQKFPNTPDAKLAESSLKRL